MQLVKSTQLPWEDRFSVCYTQTVGKHKAEWLDTILFLKQ